MAPEDFAAEYLRRERAANRKPHGADHRSILEALAAEHGIAYETARAAILDYTDTQGAG